VNQDRSRFVLGVTGHRHLQGLAHAARARLDGRLREVVDSLRRPLPDSQQPVLVSPLAEGADRIAAWQARAAGYKLHVLLPFSAAEYEHDFASDVSLAEFRDLMALADESRVLPAVDPVGQRTQAYEALGDTLIAMCDVLLALWDGHPEKGRGGTGQVVRRAVRRGVAVVHLDTKPPHDARIYLREDLELPTGVQALTQELGLKRSSLDLPTGEA